MGEARIKVRVIKTSKILQDLPKSLKRAQDLSPAMEKGISIARNVIEEEFLGSFWFTPSGGRKPWAPRKDKKKHPLLLLSNNLFNSWMGIGESVEDTTRSSFTVGSDLEYASVQRGGNLNTNISSSPLWNNITPRPHATPNPELTSRLKSMITKFITKGVL